MARATLNGVVLADSEAVEIVEGCLYFPGDRVAVERLEPCRIRTICPWRGVATYYDVRVDDHVEPAAAWSYEEPKRRARRLEGHVAFWKAIDVEP
ncbi:hypothetical protein BAL199_10972 [alpha proteobacterium BAL199]|jgi:uncharacterized protein (DUF427 family)|nr:hypothetical protein BAL199_10972 [alpha proteobacterium BAL199]